MDKQKVLIIGAGHDMHSMLGKSRYFIDHLLAAGYEVECLRPDMEAVGRKPNLTIFDDFSKLEDRMMAELIRTGTAGRINGMMFTQEDMMLPPDRRKDPKGPRGKWGKL